MERDVYCTCMCSAFSSGTSVRFEMRLRMRERTGSLWHERGSHQAVELVRTACTPSPACERAHLVPPTWMMRSASSALRKVSNDTTHGSRECTIGV